MDCDFVIATRTKSARHLRVLTHQKTHLPQIQCLQMPHVSKLLDACNMRVQLCIDSHTSIRTSTGHQFAHRLAGIHTSSTQLCMIFEQGQAPGKRWAMLTCWRLLVVSFPPPLCGGTRSSLVSSSNQFGIRKVLVITFAML